MLVLVHFFSNIAPLDILGPALVTRLKKSDCLEKGYVLDGFPLNSEEAQFLSSRGVEPNTLIWLESTDCANRIKDASGINEGEANRYEHSKKELSNYYKQRKAGSNGIFYEINADDELIDHVLERVEASLIRPVPLVVPNLAPES
jgi:adenylate kinase family enzyme